MAFEYDEAGRLTRETINGRAVSHQWDPLSGLPAGYQADTQPAVSWYYGLNGRLMQWQLDGHAPLQMQHDGLGREIARESAAGFIQSHAYTPVGLLAHQTAGRSSDWFKQTLYEADPHFPPRGSAVTRHWYYTPAYNVACIEDTRWDETRYGYNANDQVVTAQFGGMRACDEQFVYDAGQRLHYQKRVPERLSEDLRQSYHTQQAGRVIQHGACAYRYDENGRRTEKTEQRRGYRPRTWRYRWDAHDRLTGFISPEGVRWRYCYDAFGRRISKRQETDAAGPPVKPTAIIGYDYLWSGEQLIEDEQFVYDAGQRLHYQKRVPERLSEDLRQSYHTQQAGRVIQHGACTYRYDENGRRTEKTEQRRGYRPRTWRYRWDAHDRLTGFINPEGTRCAGVIAMMLSGDGLASGRRQTPPDRR